MIPNMPNWANDSQTAKELFAPVELISVANREAPLGYSFGPKAVSDTSEGLLHAYWVAFHSGGTYQLAFKDADTPEWTDTTNLFDRATKPDYLKLCFDQSGKPMVAFIESGTLFLWWYDPTKGSTAVDEIGPATSCAIGLDYPKLDNQATSDVYLFYTNAAGDLLYRIQGERFDTEHTSKNIGVGSLLDEMRYTTKREVQLSYLKVRSV